MKQKYFELGQNKIIVVKLAAVQPLKLYKHNINTSSTQGMGSVIPLPPAPLNPTKTLK